ncbi:hypothetical protein V5799_018221 [Amblyomma americanum]|uniref:Uncharacterized protein n=1 Tax=Amblyomma americanum TaxID=6943 RepID=A0AAQ4F132_AMBAM
MGATVAVISRQQFKTLDRFKTRPDGTTPENVPMTVDVGNQGVPLRVELDTGSTVAVISRQQFKTLTAFKTPPDGTTTENVPITVDAGNQGVPLRVELDTGTTVAVISRQQFKTLRPLLNLHPTELRLKPYALP